MKTNLPDEAAPETAAGAVSAQFREPKSGTAVHPEGVDLSPTSATLMALVMRMVIVSPRPK